jgi:hypothetical protein
MENNTLSTDQKIVDILFDVREGKDPWRAYKEILQLISDNYISKEELHSVTINSQQSKPCDCSLMYQCTGKFLCHGNCKW